MKNILLLMTDQQRYDAAGFAGNRDIATPSLDRLAAEGAVYEQAYTPFPLCVPARHCLMRGCYPDARMLAGRHELAQGESQFVQVLRRAGYRTAAVGKMHFNPMYADHGFDIMRLAEHDPSIAGCFTEDDYHRELAEAGMRDEQEEWQFPTKFAGASERYRHRLQAETFPLPTEWHSSSWIGREAVRTLDGLRGGPQPYFLWVSFLRPHHPFNPPAEYAGPYMDKALDLPEDPSRWTASLPDWLAPVYRNRLSHGAYDLSRMDRDLLHRITAYYYAAITHIDEWIGCILDRVARDNTLILFTSDHGEYLGHRDRLFKDPQTALDDLARVPLLAVYPDGHGAGTRVRDAVSLVDVAPTLLEEAGIDSSLWAEMEGCSLRRAHHGRPVFAVAQQPVLNVMVRQAQWKLIWYPERQEGLLYDMEQDPGELVNLYADPQYRETIGALAHQAEHFLKTHSRPI